MVWFEQIKYEFRRFLYKTWFPNRPTWDYGVFEYKKNGIFPKVSESSKNGSISQNLYKKPLKKKAVSPAGQLKNWSILQYVSKKGRLKYSIVLYVWSIYLWPLIGL